MQTAVQRVAPAGVRNYNPAANAAAIKQAVAAKMDSAAFASWVAPLEFSVCDSVLTLSAPNQFSADFIRRSYINTIENIAADFSLSVQLAVAGKSSVAAAPSNDNEIRNAKYEIRNENNSAAAEKGFVSFITSDENAFAVSAAKKLASGAATFSPLFIYGPAGCGKSLLASCIKNDSAGKTIMMGGAQFVSEFVRSMSEKSVFAFKDFCRDCDTFIMDDVQFLAGKRASAEEFVALVLDLIKYGKNVVLIANGAPAALGGFDRRAQSVFASGLVVDIAAPVKSVRRAMLMRSGLTSDVADIVAARIAADGHLIAGVIKKIGAYAELMNEKITVAVAEKLLADTLEKNKTPLAMVRIMCEKLGVSFDEICSPARGRTIVRARQIMMTALKSATRLSLSEIGNLIGGRDHATVLYALHQIEKQKSADLILSAEIEQMIEICR
ncbi:MAG: AAA family ATPase [Rickettsiales bacterium]|jgi:chromosomal replication initiator protein|nr:AAA family ATPase [Rickettsiales bacterium]